MGRRSTATVDWHRTPKIRFSKCATVAEKQRRFLENSVELLNSMDTCGDNALEMDCGCDDEPPCQQGCDPGCGCA